MKSLTIDDLRALIRLIPPAQALQEELEKSLHLETFEGMGNLAVRSFQGLQQSAHAITEDPYLTALTIEIDDLGDKQMVAQVLLAVSQLVAYLEGQAGIAGLTKPRSYSVQTAPHITLNMDGFDGGPIEIDRVMDTIDRALRFKPPTPPTPPRPPRPPRFHREQRIEIDDEDDEI